MEDWEECSCEEASGVFDRDIEVREDEGVEGAGTEALRLTPSGVDDRAVCAEADGGPSEARRLEMDLRPPRDALGKEDRMEVGVADVLTSPLSSEWLVEAGEGTGLRKAVGVGVNIPAPGRAKERRGVCEEEEAEAAGVVMMNGQRSRADRRDGRYRLWSRAVGVM